MNKRIKHKAIEIELMKFGEWFFDQQPPLNQGQIDAFLSMTKFLIEDKAIRIPVPVMGKSIIIVSKFLKTRGIRLPAKEMLKPNNFKYVPLAVHSLLEYMKSNYNEDIK